MRRFLGLFVLVLLAGLAAWAQSETETEENGFLANLLQNQLSAPGRQIKLSGVEGLLSSRATIGLITVSDDSGPWLRIENTELDWSRSALLLGRVSVEKLSAERIEWLRPAQMPEQPPLPRAEAKPFELPDLPVSINLQALEIGRFELDPSVFGEGAVLSASGSLQLADGALDASLEARRLDDPGGQFDLSASFANETRQLALDVRLQEPQGGLVSSLLAIENEPAIDLRLTGEGPLEDVDIDFSLDAGGQRLADGKVALRETPAGLGFDAEFGGELAPLIPADYRDFFAGRSSILVEGVSKSEGGLRLDTLNVAGSVLNLEGRLETGPDGFPRSLSLTGGLGDPAGPPVLLPVPGADTTLNSAELYVSYGNAARWNGLLVLDRLSAAEIGMEDVTLTMGGLAQNLDDPDNRNVTINLEGLATGVTSDDPEIDAALGDRLDLFADVALPPGAPVEVRQLQLSGSGLSIFSAGTVEDLVYTGRNAVRIDDLAQFAGIAGRDLSGGLNLRATGSVTPLSGGFNLALDGTATDLRLGDPRLNALLAGTTTLGGRAVRDENGIRTEELRLENPQLRFASDGRISTERTDIGFDARLNDLALIDPRLSGALTASGNAEGAGQDVDVSLEAAIPTGSLLEKPITDLTLAVDGTVDGSDVTATLDGSGTLDAVPVRLAGDIAQIGETRRISDLALTVGQNSLTGNLARTGEAPFTGTLSLDAPQLGSLAALALIEASGTADADIALSAGELGQTVAITGSARDVVAGETRIGDLDIDADIRDALGLPMVDGTLDARGLTAGGIEVSSLTAQARQSDPEVMQFTADTRLAVGTTASLAGSLERLEPGFAVTLETLRLRQNEVSAELPEPATVTLRGETITLTPLRIDFGGGGSLTAQGRVEEDFDLELDINALPLGLANTIKPDLGLAGRIDGTARITGARAEPDVRFDIAASEFAAEATRSAGLPPLSLDASGQTQGGRLNLDATLASAGGLASSIQGSVPLGEGALDLAIDLQTFPLALIDRLSGGQGLVGSVSGTATVTGPIADPTARFDLSGTGLSARIMRENAISPLSLEAEGGYQSAALTLDSVEVTGGRGLTLSGSGRVPFSGPGLDVQVSGALPLDLANAALASRDAQATGRVDVEASAAGSLADPRLSGSVSVADATLVDPQTNIRLENIAVDASLQGNNVVLSGFSANAVAGGSISGSGQVSLNAAQGYPADLDLAINGLRYTDGSFVTTQISGDLALQGPVLDGGTLSGQIALGETEISVAEGLGANAQAALAQVEHLRPPPRVVQTLERAQVEAPSTAAEQAPNGGLNLDIRITAPRQIFVRGRGLDAELSGELTVRGTTSSVQPVGEFDLRRGRLSILGQRIDFDEGALRLIGDLDPQLYFVARTQSEDVTAIVTVEGSASDPQITFSSEPELPQDEILARILFNRATQDLSPFQLAQLAAAAAELAGGGSGPGVLEQLRGATGLDDLDIVTEQDGSTAVRAGKYISDNVYLDVQTGSDGTSRAQVNLDITDQITTRGSVASDGNTTFGIFYERDY